MGRTNRGVVAALLAMVSLALSLPGTAGAQDAALQVFYVAFGQGDAAVWRGPCGEVGIIDAGAGSTDELLGVLAGLGSRQVAWIAPSHGDTDHLGGVVDLATADGVEVEAVIDPFTSADDHPTETFAEYWAYATGPSVQRRQVDIGDTFDLCGTVTFGVVSAGYDGTAVGGLEVSEANDKGACLHIRYGAFDAASCGDVNGTDESFRTDIESAVAPLIGPVELVKINHHGSVYSSNDAYVGTLSPAAAVVQVGANSFGHPVASVLERWRAEGASVFQTLVGDTEGTDEGQPLDGTVLVTVVEGSFTVTGTASGRSETFAFDQTDGGGGPDGVPGAGENAFDGDPATTERLAISDPTAAAVAVSQLRFPAAGSAGAAVLSRNDTFADSLAGAPLTGNAPLLYATPPAIPQVTVDELTRALRPGGRVYLLGGQAALSTEVEQQLQQLEFEVVRLGGATRVETSVTVAAEVLRLHPERNEVAVARSDGPADNPTAAWADSISGGAWTAHLPTPLVLTPTDTLHPAVAAFAAELNPDVSWVFGGTAAISEKTSDGLPNVIRVAGSARDVTASAAVPLYGEPTGRYVVVNGYDDSGWALGLAAAGIAADASAPLLYTQTDLVPSATLERHTRPCGSGPGIDTLLVGGTDLISPSVTQALAAADGAPCPPPEPEPNPEPPPEPPPPPEPEPEPACDPSYPDVCIPPPPPDLDCPDIPHRNFRVIGADPHRFDGDNDGIGCEES